MEKKKNEVTNPEPAAQLRAYRRQMRITIGAMILAVGVTAMSTMAWFANNRKVEANKMEMQVEATENLVISKASTGEYSTTVEFSASGIGDRKFKPATHDYTENCAAPKLKFVRNPEAVSYEKGLAIDNATNPLDYGIVSLDANSPYYIDYTVDIASIGKAFANQDLKATLKITKADGTDWTDTTKDYVQAATIDFWVDGNYVTKLAVRDGATAVNVLENRDIPLVEAKTPITVTMRCYFDGELTKTGDDTTTYVRSQGLTIGDIFALHVTFEAPDHTA